MSTPYGGQTVLPFGCFNPGNRTCLYLLDCRQGVPQCLSEFGSEETKNRWISEIVIRIILNKMLNYCSRWVYNPTNAIRGATHGIHQLLHVSTPRWHLQGVITTKMYMPTCQYISMFACTCRSLCEPCVFYYEVHLLDNILIVSTCTVWIESNLLYPSSCKRIMTHYEFSLMRPVTLHTTHSLEYFMLFN